MRVHTTLETELTNLASHSSRYGLSIGRKIRSSVPALDFSPPLHCIVNGACHAKYRITPSHVDHHDLSWGIKSSTILPSTYTRVRLIDFKYWTRIHLEKRILFFSSVEAEEKLLNDTTT